MSISETLAKTEDMSVLRKIRFRSSAVSQRRSRVYKRLNKESFTLEARDHAIRTPSKAASRLTRESQKKYILNGSSSISSSFSVVLLDRSLYIIYCSIFKLFLCSRAIGSFSVRTRPRLDDHLAETLVAREEMSIQTSAYFLIFWCSQC